MDDEGECLSGISGIDGGLFWYVARWCTLLLEARGMGTLFVVVVVFKRCWWRWVTGRATIDAVGDDDDDARWCVGCEYGSAAASPIRLSNGRPSYVYMHSSVLII